MIILENLLLNKTNMRKRYTVQLKPAFICTIKPADMVGVLGKFEFISNGNLDFLEMQVETEKAGRRVINKLREKTKVLYSVGLDTILLASLEEFKNKEAHIIYASARDGRIIMERVEGERLNDL